MSNRHIPFPNTTKFEHFGFTFNSHASLEDNINSFISKISTKQEKVTQNKIKLMRDCMEEQEYKIQTKLINNQNSPTQNQNQNCDLKMDIQEFNEEFFSQNNNLHDKALSEIFYQNQRNITKQNGFLQKIEHQQIIKYNYKQAQIQEADYHHHSKQIEEADYNHSKDETLQSIFNQIWLDGNNFQRHWYDQE